jgi:hypothetical protein
MAGEVPTSRILNILRPAMRVDPHATSDERMQSFGAIVVDAERALEAVVDDVLRVALGG